MNIEEELKKTKKIADLRTKVWRKFRLNIGNKKQYMEDLRYNLVKIYTKLIRKYVKKYKKEFVNFFSNNSNPLRAFDIEQHPYSRYPICFLAVEISPRLKVKVRLIHLNDIDYIKQNSKIIHREMEKWLKKIPKSIILSHGKNKMERNLIQNSGHIPINTEEIINEYNKNQKKNENKIPSIGLGSFEDFINHHRQYCGFFKHGFKRNRYPIIFKNLLKISLIKHYMDKEQRICPECGKEQDILGYCLEDALSCILIYIMLKENKI